MKRKDLIITKLILLTAICMAYVTPIMAQSQLSALQFKYKVKDDELYYDYKQNRAEFEKLKNLIEMKKDSIKRGLLKIQVRGFASNNYVSDQTMQLAKTRSLRLKSYIIKNFGVQESFFYTINTIESKQSGPNAVILNINDNALNAIDVELVPTAKSYKTQTAPTTEPTIAWTPLTPPAQNHTTKKEETTQSQWNFEPIKTPATTAPPKTNAPNLTTPFKQPTDEYLQQHTALQNNRRPNNEFELLPPSFSLNYKTHNPKKIRVKKERNIKTYPSLESNTRIATTQKTAKIKPLKIKSSKSLPNESVYSTKPNTSVSTYTEPKHTAYKEPKESKYKEPKTLKNKEPKPEKYKAPKEPLQLTQPKLSLGINALYLLAVSPNLELDIFMGRHLSLSIEGQYSYLTGDHGYKRYHTWSVAPELRYWFKGDRTFTGHSLGLYVSCGSFDLKNGATGHQGDFAQAGLSYNYVLPVGRRTAFRFGLSAGYVRTQGDSYHSFNLPLYTYLDKENMQYIGITRAAVSFIVRIGNKK